jgi:hypothetical protein
VWGQGGEASDQTQSTSVTTGSMVIRLQRKHCAAPLTRGAPGMKRRGQPLSENAGRQRPSVAPEGRTRRASSVPRCSSAAASAASSASRSAPASRRAASSCSRASDAAASPIAPASDTAASRRSYDGVGSQGGRGRTQDRPKMWVLRGMPASGLQPLHLNAEPQIARLRLYIARRLRPQTCSESRSASSATSCAAASCSCDRSLDWSSDISASSRTAFTVGCAAF